jgi:hypothetical protein
MQTLALQPLRPLLLRSTQTINILLHKVTGQRVRPGGMVAFGTGRVGELDAEGIRAATWFGGQAQL